LCVRENELKELPREIENLLNLDMLYVDRTMTIKYYLGEKYSPYLVSINLDNKNLTKIPPDIFVLRNLIELDISNNKLVEITRFISKLIHLKKIDMHSNNLKGLPDFLWDLPELEEMIIDGNLLPCIPNNIKADHTLIEPIRNFLIARKNNLSLSDNEIKKELGTLQIFVKENKVSMISNVVKK